MFFPSYEQAKYLITDATQPPPAKHLEHAKTQVPDVKRTEEERVSRFPKQEQRDFVPETMYSPPVAPARQVFKQPEPVWLPKMKSEQTEAAETIKQEIAEDLPTPEPKGPSQAELDRQWLLDNGLFPAYDNPEQEQRSKQRKKSKPQQRGGRRQMS